MALHSRHVYNCVCLSLNFTLDICDLVPRGCASVVLTIGPWPSRHPKEATESSVDYECVKRVLLYSGNSLDMLHVRL